MYTLKYNNNKKEVKRNIIYLGIFLLLVGFVQMLFGKSFSVYFYIVGFSILVIGVFFPKLSGIIILILYRVGFYLGLVNSKVLLTVFYYIFLTPIGLILKMTGKKHLDLEIKKDDKSYWIKRENVEFKKEDFKNQF